MLSVALLSILLPVATPAFGQGSPSRALAADPSVRVSLDHRDYEPGDQARVTVRVRDDGYLLVLRLSADGYARVLFPLDPGDDNFVRGDGEYEIRGRGDRSAFTVDDNSGTGTVYAAWSSEPFRFNDFVRGDHWDYRVIDGSLLQGDPEAGLTDLAQRMSTGHFDYDLVSYSVVRPVAYSGTTHYVNVYPTVYPTAVGCYGIYDPWCPRYLGYYPRRSFFSVSIGFGRPWGWGRVRFYDSFYYDPFYHDPFYYDPFYYSHYYPRYHGCYYCGPRVVVINRPGFHGRSRYQWKPGSFGGGGRPGVQYRPRTIFASTNARVSSPLFVASKYRRVVSDSRPGGRRLLDNGAISVPRSSSGGAVVGATRRVRGSSEATSAVSRGPVAPRRAQSAEGSDRRSGSTILRRSPRVEQGGGASSPRARSGSPSTKARRVEPRATTPSSSGARPRSTPRRSDPATASPRAASPSRSPSAAARGRVEPRSSSLRRVEPRTSDRRVEPSTRVESRSTARRVEPSTRVESRSTVRRIEPSTRVVRPDRSQQRSMSTRAEPQRVSPRSVQPSRQVRRAEPRAQTQRVQSRSQPQRTHVRSAPPQRSQPRAAPSRSQPRSTPSSRSPSSRRRP